MSEVVKVKNIAGAFIIGFAAGDALGVPVEFATRQQLQKEPIREMIGYGNHCQRVGTWSDDTSLTIATIDSLADGYNPNDIAARFARWLEDGEYTANGSTFDVGFTTRFAIKRAKNSTGNFIINGREIALDQMLEEVRNKTEIGEDFTIEVFKNVITFMMKFGGDEE